MKISRDVSRLQHHLFRARMTSSKGLAKVTGSADEQKTKSKGAANQEHIPTQGKLAYLRL